MKAKIQELLPKIIRKGFRFLCAITCLLGVATASETVTRTGFLEKIDVQNREVIVDSKVYALPENAKVIVGDEIGNIQRLKEGDFVILAVKRGTSQILMLVVRKHGLEE